MPIFSYEEWKLLFEQFEKYVLKKEEFIIPDKWCIKTCKEVGDWLDVHSDMDKKYRMHPGYAASRFKYLLYPSIGASHIYNNIKRGYKEITIEQFKKYVLKEEKFVLPKKEENMKNFCIVGSLPLLEAFIKDSGYKFHDNKLPQYYEEGYSYLTSSDYFVAFKIIPDDVKQFSLPSQYSEALEYVKEYFSSKKEKTVTIDGYESKIEGDDVKFGCHHITKEELQALKVVMNLSERLDGLTILPKTTKADRNENWHISDEQIEILLKKM